MSSNQLSPQRNDALDVGPDSPDVSVCVIGRNEARNLEACAMSLSQLRHAGLTTETMFIDSASSDSSVEIAAAHFDVVVELEASPQLNAGAARAAGTDQARGRWVLYLDGDMRLRSEFLQPMLKLVCSKARIDGLVGGTVNRYPDGTCDLMVLAGNVEGQPCKAFGGAVLLRRSAVMAAGNWAPNLFSNEEVELYSRLLPHSAPVLWTETPMVDHVTAKFTASNKLRGSLLPWGSYLGKKFFGAGQALRRAWQLGHLSGFVHLKPLQYTMTAAIMLALVLLPFAPGLAPWPPLAAFAWITARRGPKFAMYCICWTSQTAFGLTRLDSGYRPVLRRVYRAGVRRTEQP